MRVISHVAFKKRLIKKCALSLLITSKLHHKKRFEQIDSLNKLRFVYPFQSNFGFSKHTYKGGNKLVWKYSS